MPIEKSVCLKIIQTSDIHGNFFPYDFINRTANISSLANVSSYVKQRRKEFPKRLIVLDSGDILQGQPTCYYSNFINPEPPNLATSVIRYIGYDAQAIGNHDIETGHDVYDKWVKESSCSIICANIIDTKTKQPYLAPYKIIERCGLRIAVIGMLTPAIPHWLNETLWSGLRFDDIVESADYWAQRVKEEENPHLIIGLFHSGWNGGITTSEYIENQVLDVAKNVPLFDVIFLGHDHHKRMEKVQRQDGTTVLCLNPACNAMFASEVDIKVTLRDNVVVGKEIKGEIQDMSSWPIDEDYVDFFKSEIENIKSYTNRKIGTFKHAVHTRDAYFGSSAYSDFIHNIQLKVTGADISINAPLTFDASINEGDVHVSDLFNLYKYENQIYVVRMTGLEIVGLLEMSYALWVNTVTSEHEHVIMMKTYIEPNGHKRYGFKNLAFDFDTAAGIDYEVDVTKPKGKRVKVLQMSDGKPFDLNAVYNVAMNSYRGNGGGELLTKGAGISHEELAERRVYESPFDQRYYIMKEIEEQGVLDLKPNDNWKFVPSDMVEAALSRDYKLLFEDM